jgi:hypothetical protein
LLGKKEEGRKEKGRQERKTTFHQRKNFGEKYGEDFSKNKPRLLPNEAGRV